VKIYVIDKYSEHIEFKRLKMESCIKKGDFIERFLDSATKRWGKLEVEEMKTSLTRTAEAAWKIKGLSLDPYEEPLGKITGG